MKEVVVDRTYQKVYMVMEYAEHDLKSLMEVMQYPFSQSEVKCLMVQLVSAVKCAHSATFVPGLAVDSLAMRHIVPGLATGTCTTTGSSIATSSSRICCTTTVGSSRGAALGSVRTVAHANAPTCC